MFWNDVDLNLKINQANKILSRYKWKFGNLVLLIFWKFDKSLKRYK